MYDVNTKGEILKNLNTALLHMNTFDKLKKTKLLNIIFMLSRFKYAEIDNTILDVQQKAFLLLYCV